MVEKIIFMLLIAASPLVELRGAIPYGIAVGISPWVVFALSTLANIVMAPVLFLLLEWTLHVFEKNKTLGNFIKRVRDSAHAKVAPHLERHGYLGLAIFVAIPLPLTGVWTATLVAYFLKMERKKAILAIAAGAAVAGVLVTLASVGVLESLKIFL